MTKYENIVKQKEQNKEPADIDALAKKYSMNVIDVKKLKEYLHSKDYWKDPDYKFLVEENAELQKRIIDLEQEVLETKLDNKKLAQQISTMLERMRDADF
jgi:hypothetical protein